MLKRNLWVLGLDTFSILLVTVGFSIPAFAQPSTSPCPPLPAPVFAGYCAIPRNPHQAISGGSFTVTVPSVSDGSPGGTLSMAISAVLCKGPCSVSNIGLIGTGVTMRSNGTDFMFAPGSTANVQPGDTFTLSIATTSGGYLLEVQDLTSGASVSGVVPTNLPILAMNYIMSVIQSPNFNQPPPVVIPTFGSVSITNAHLLIGTLDLPLRAATDVAMSMIYPSGDTLASPTSVTGETFTIVQLATS